MKTYYEILQVKEDASAEIIESAYRFLLQKYRNLNPALGQEKINTAIRAITQAHEVLSNPAKKAKYDYWLVQQRNYTAMDSIHEDIVETKLNQPNPEKIKSGHNTDYQGYHPIRKTAILFTALSWGILALAVLFVIILSTLTTGKTTNYKTLDMLENISGVVGFIFLLIILFDYILLVLFVRRAVSNLISFRIKISVNPDIAMVLLLIPLVNFVALFFIFGMIWDGTLKLTEDKSKNYVYFLWGASLLLSVIWPVSGFINFLVLCPMIIIIARYQEEYYEQL